MSINFKNLSADVRGFGSRYATYLEQKSVELDREAKLLQADITLLQEQIQSCVSMPQLMSTTNTLAAAGLKLQVFFVLMTIYLIEICCIHLDYCWSSGNGRRLGYFGMSWSF